MIKFAAIVTSAALACSGASHHNTNRDIMAARLAALKCAKPSVAICEQQPDCSTPCDADCKIDCSIPCTDGSQCDKPAATPPAEPGVPAPTRTPAPTQAPETDDNPGSVSAYAQEVVRLVNIERANAGLAPLKLDLALCAAAQVRAQEIDTSFSHTRPNGTSCFTVLKEMGISYRACGENIAKGSPTPARVVDGWMNSAGHRANILNKNFTTIGVGVYEDAAGTLHWAQLFTA